MSKVLVIYYSSYGHIEAMANPVAEGARQAGAHVDIKRVPELVPEEIARKSHYKFDQASPIAKVEDLAAYDAIVIGAGTRFGRLPSQMANFLDQAGGLLGARSIARQGRRRVYVHRHATWRAGDHAVLDHHQSPALRHGGCRPRLRPCGQMTLEEITGGSPLRRHDGGDGSRLPTANELQGARYQGRKIAETASKLHGWSKWWPTSADGAWSARSTSIARRGASLSEIAVDCRLSSQSSFIRAFRRAEGTGPQQRVLPILAPAAGPLDVKTET